MAPMTIHRPMTTAKSHGKPDAPDDFETGRCHCSKTF